MNGFAHRIITAEREGHIRNSPRDTGVRQVLANPACRFDKINGIVIMLVDACRNREDIRVEDDVLWGKV